MTVQDAINADLYPLKPTTSAKKALHLMTEGQVRHLPIVTNRQLSGMVSETQLENLENLKTEVGGLLLGQPISIDIQAHPYEAARLLTQYDLTSLPVLENNDYVGMVTRRDLFVSLVEMLGINRDGAVLVMDVEMRDFSIATISHLL